MEEDIRMNGDWYIPETNETIDIRKGIIDTGGKILLYDCIIGEQNNCLGQRTTVSVSAKAAFWNLDIESKEELMFPKVIMIRDIVE